MALPHGPSRLFPTPDSVTMLTEDDRAGQADGQRVGPDLPAQESPRQGAAVAGGGHAAIHMAVEVTALSRAGRLATASSIAAPTVTEVKR